ncbi:MAG TPA: class I SAM-dependent methyltransferase [Syntrophorhabdaceae bacterium]|nr:class I SAM-dependent methyltransferase [Syntrophorhabdaceae bacterium]
MKLNWAERWVVNNPLRVVQQRMELKKLKAMLPLKPHFTALEIGCGRAAGAGLILEEFLPSMIYATDLDVHMLEKARDYLPSEKRKNIVLVAADGSSLPFRDGSIDAVFDFGVLHHIVDWRRAVSEIARVLKPEGAFFLEELYPTLYQNLITRHILLHPRRGRFRSDDLKHSLAREGLLFKDCRELKAVGILGVALKAP